MSVSADKNFNRSISTGDYDFMTPEELLEAFCGGDDAAFCCLVDQLGPRLLGFLQRYMGDIHAAEDVFQEVLVKLAVNAEKYDQRARLCTWLYRIARNCAIDALRQRGKLREYSASTLYDSSDGGGIDLAEVFGKDLPPDEQLTVAELGQRISAAVEALPPEQKEVFLLREDADLTFEEIGELLGCGKETAKSRMRYALRRLQSALGEQARLYGLLAGL